MSTLPLPSDSKTHKATPHLSEIDQEKFRQYLRETDQLLNERKFEDAKSRLAKAKAIDHANPYIAAFETRIQLFQSNPSLSASPVQSVTATKKRIEPSPIKASKPTDQIPGTREVIEQKLRAQIEAEYKTKFMQELHKAEVAATKSLEEERSKIEHQRHLLKAQFDRQVEETQKRLEQEYLNRLNEEITASEERLKHQFQKEQSFIETELKTRLSTHYEQQMTELQKKLNNDQSTLLVAERQSFTTREKSMKEQFDRKLLDALRKTEVLFREQSLQLQELEQEKLRKQLTDEFQSTLEKEREAVKREHDTQREKLERSYAETQKKLAEESQRQINSQIELIRAKETAEFEKKRIVLRQEIESEQQKKFEVKIAGEQTRIQNEATGAIEKEKERLQTEYDAMVVEQNKKIQTVRNEIRNEMEQMFIKRLEHVASEYDHKMELLGTKIPQTAEEKTTLYRERMRECYVNSQPSEEDAKRLMELKELLELSFDDHLLVESDVRLNLYVESVEKKIMAGALSGNDAASLDEIKYKFRISREEATRLEPYILNSFQRLAVKGRILLADDEPMLLESIGNILTDCGYQIITALDVKTALEKLDTTHVDLIVSDIKFAAGDELDGFKFFKAVQEKPPLRSIPFVFMSSLKDGVIIRSGMQLGIDDYLTKPADPDLLIAVIEGKLKRYRESRGTESRPLVFQK